jgi:hypothetical protein
MKNESLQLEFAWERVAAMDGEIKKLGHATKCAIITMQLAASRLRLYGVAPDVAEDLDRVAGKLTAGTFPL